MGLQLRTGVAYDKIVGNIVDHEIVLAGECAFQRCGLSSHFHDRIQAWSIYADVPTVPNEVLVWFFNPFALNYSHTIKSTEHSNILIPTQERAVVEYMIFNHYFNEGILIEGIQDYLRLHDNNVNDLYSVGAEFYLRQSYIDYWIKEAVEDTSLEY